MIGIEETKYDILHVTHNDSDAYGCDVLIKTFFRHCNVFTKYGIAGKGDEAFYALWDEYFGLTLEQQQEERRKRSSLFEKQYETPYFYVNLEDPVFVEKLRNLKFIFITDISISEKLAAFLVATLDTIYRKIDSIDIKLVGIDHHITNKTNNVSPDHFTVEEKVYLDGIYEGAAPAVIKDDMKKPVSAAFLTYHYLMNNSEMLLSHTEHGRRLKQITYFILHWITAYISEYDTWMWRKDPGALINRLINLSMKKKIEVDHKRITADIFKKVIDVIGIKDAVDYTVDFIVKTYEESDTAQYKRQIIPEFFFDIMSVTSMMENHEVDRFLNSNKLHIHDQFGYEYVMAVFFSENSFSNRICEEIYNKYDFVDIVCVIYPASGQVGFRTNRKDVNVGRFARRLFRGGGHVEASGAHLEPKAMEEFVRKYYYDAQPIKDYLTVEVEED